MAELFANRRRSHQLADDLNLGWAHTLKIQDRPRGPLLESAPEKGPRSPSPSRFLVRAWPLGQRFRAGGAGAEPSGRLRQDPIETAGRGA